MAEKYKGTVKKRVLLIVYKRGKSPPVESGRTQQGRDPIRSLAPKRRKHNVEPGAD